jgi:hypothetical protein
MSTGYLPTRSTKPLTEPEDVNFRTDHRLRGVPVEEDHRHEPVIEVGHLREREGFKIDGRRGKVLMPFNRKTNTG